MGMDSNGGGLFGEIARSWRSLGLPASPLLADLMERDRSWWRFLLGLLAGTVGGILLVIVLLVVIGVPALIIALVQGFDPAQLSDFYKQIQREDYSPTYWVAIGLIWLLVLTNGPTLVGFAWIGSLFNRKPLRLSFTTAPRWRWRQLVGGLALYGAVLGLVVAFETVVFKQPLALPLFKTAPTVGKAVVFLALTVPAWVLAAMVEELAFRGWLLRHSALMLRWTWLYILLNGAVFSIIHWDFQPAHFDLNAFLARMAMGWGLCYMALKMGGIEFSTGAHAANNLLLVLFIEPFNLAVPDGKPFDWGGLGETVVLLALMIAVTEVALRVPWIAQLVGPPSDGARPPEQVFS